MGLTRWFSATMPTFAIVPYLFLLILIKLSSWAVLKIIQLGKRKGSSKLNPLKYKRINQELKGKNGFDLRKFETVSNLAQSCWINQLWPPLLSQIPYSEFQISLFWHLEKFKMLKKWPLLLATLAFTVSLISTEKSLGKEEERQSELGNYSKAAVALDSGLCATVGK